MDDLFILTFIYSLNIFHTITSFTSQENDKGKEQLSWQTNKHVKNMIAANTFVAIQQEESKIIEAYQ